MNYKIQETSTMPGQVIRNMWKYSIIKVYPDKSALIEAAVEKMETGTTVADLKAKEGFVPGWMKQYYLFTADARIYIVGGGMPGTENEIEDLKKAKDTKKWFKSTERTPMDWYKLPLKKLTVNSSVTRSLPGETQKWKITRLKDENIAGKNAEVYEAKDSTGSITEIYRYDGAGKKVLKRIMHQGPDVTIEQVRM